VGSPLPIADSKGQAVESLRQQLLALWQCPRAEGAHGKGRGRGRGRGDRGPEELSRLRDALKLAEKSQAFPDDQLLGMAASQCGKIGNAKPVALLCAFAAPQLQQCGGRAVVELGQASFKLDCVDASFIRAAMSYFASPPPEAFGSLRDLAGAASLLLQSVRKETLAVNHEGGLQGLAEAALPLLRRLKPHAQPRDAAELAHGLSHAVPLLSLSTCELNAVAATLSEAFQVLRRSMHVASARDAAMVAGAAAAAWPSFPELRDKALRPCLQDVAQMARFDRNDAFQLQDLSSVAAAFAKLGDRNEVFAEVLERRVLGKGPELSCRDLCHLLWAAACVPGWSSEAFAADMIAECLRREKRLFSVKDICTLAQSLIKLVEASTPAALAALESITAEGLRRSLSEEDKSCMTRARQLAQTKSKEKPAQEDVKSNAGEWETSNVDPEEKSTSVEEATPDVFCATPSFFPQGCYELPETLHLPPGLAGFRSSSETHGHAHAHAHGQSCSDCGWHGTGNHDGHGHIHGHSHGHGDSHGNAHAEALDLDKLSKQGLKAAEAGLKKLQPELWNLIQKEHSPGASVCPDENCCQPLSSSDFALTEVHLNSHCSFAGHCVKMKNTFIHIPCNSFSDSESEAGDCVVCAIRRSRSCEDLGGHGDS